MTRWKASAIHFAISFVVLASLFTIILFRWYPPALFGMAKAGPLLAVLAGVDLVLGPLLTLIIYRPGKKGLKFDLVVIAILQVAALAFGLHTVWQSRPAYIVATTDRFHLSSPTRSMRPAPRRPPPNIATRLGWGRARWPRPCRKTPRPAWKP